MKFSIIERGKLKKEYGCKLVEELFTLGQLAVYLDEKTCIWSIEKGREGIKATKISEDLKKFQKFNVNRKGLYLLGTEGLFLISSNETKKIYDGKIDGCRIMKERGIIFLFQNQNPRDVIIQLDPNNIGRVKTTLSCRVLFVGMAMTAARKQLFGTSSERRILIEENSKYFKCTIGIQDTGIYKEMQLSEDAALKILKEGIGFDTN